ncbi:MAG TPA: SARP family transcriptional regulator, partial [Pseudonocardiaceae bacterium]
MSSPHLAVRAAGASSSDAELNLARGAELLHQHGDLAGARTCFERAYHLAHAAGEPGLLAAAALGEGGLWVHERRRAADAARVAEHQEYALAQLDPSSPLALPLRVRLAAEAGYRSGDPRKVLTLLDQTRRRGDPHEVSQALSLAHHCLLGPQHARARLALAEELLRVAARTHRPGDVLIGLLWRAVDLFLLGSRHADRGYAELVDTERRHPHAAAHYVITAIRVMLSIRAGRLRDAEELALSCLRCGDAAGDEDATGWYGAHLFAIRWYQGRAAEAGAGAAELAGSPTLSAVDHAFVAAQAVASASAGDRRHARGALAQLCGRDLGALPRSSSWLPALCGVV